MHKEPPAVACLSRKVTSGGPVILVVRNPCQHANTDRGVLPSSIAGYSSSSLMSRVSFSAATALLTAARAAVPPSLA